MSKRTIRIPDDIGADFHMGAMVATTPGEKLLIGIGPAVRYPPSFCAENYICF